MGVDKKRTLICSIFIIGILLTGCDEDISDIAESEIATVSDNSIIVEKLIDDNSTQIPVTEFIPDSQIDNQDGLQSANEAGSYESEQDISEKPQLDEEMLSEETILEDSEKGDTDISETNLEEVVQVSSIPAGSVILDKTWKYADYSVINSGSAVMYKASDNRKNIVIGVNAGHGTKGGSNAKTYSHPDMSPKVTGGTTAAGNVMSTAVSGGMSFADGTSEASVTLREAQILRDKLLSKGYDVLMIRDGSDVQLDNIARTVICNNTANCHIAIHWDGDNLSYDKGCFYISTPDGIKNMEPVASTWTRSEALGQSLITGLKSTGCKIYNGGSMAIDLTQTSYSTIPSVDIELGNAASKHDDATLSLLADGLCAGIDAYYY